MVTQAEKKRRKLEAQKKADKIKADKIEENEFDDNEEYTSPLEDIFDNLQEIGEGVKMVHDRANDRILLDINYAKRRGISSTLKTVKIATGSYSVFDKMKLTLNIYDKDFNDEELIEKEKLINRRIKQKELDKKLKALEN